MHERWKGIDMAVSLRFTGSRDRAESLDRELARVGLDTLSIWQFPSPVYPFLRDRLPRLDGGMRGSRGFFNSGFGHYRAWKTCFELGAGHCLVVEDDVRFMRSLPALDAGLAALPGDYDIALLDKIMCADADADKIARFCAAPEARVCDGWIRPWKFDGAPRSFAAYMLSRKGMSALIARFESSVSARPRWRLRVVDALLRGNRLHADVNLYLAHPNLAEQSLVRTARPSTSGSGHDSNDGHLARFYRAIGCPPEDYGE